MAEGAAPRVCASCGLSNAPQAAHCIKCGAELAAQAAPPPPDRGEPKTFPQSTIPAPPPGHGLPLAGISNQTYTPPPPTAPPRPEPAGPPQTIGYRPGLSALVKPALGLLLLAAVGFTSWLLWTRREVGRRAEIAGPRAAQMYLSSLARGDVAGAYDLLTKDARANCSLEEFRLLRDATPWTWSGIRAARVEEGAVLVEYVLKVDGKAAETDYLQFVREDGKWLRPYNWNLLKMIEADFDRNDPDAALVKAQFAVKINPRDPMARGYLCEAVYYRKVPQDTERECDLALRLADAYPSKLSAKSLYHLHAILGDTYKNALRKYPQAAEEYTAMLSFPSPAPEDQCDLWLARADAYSAMAKSSEAAADLSRASGVCTKPEDVEFIRQKRAALGAR